MATPVAYILRFSSYRYSEWVGQIFVGILTNDTIDIEQLFLSISIYEHVFLSSKNEQMFAFFSKQGYYFLRR